MAVYKMVVAYDGTAYHGWQRQPDAITVVQTLETTFKAVFKQEISISGASRTDAGVHALGQVASFALDMQIAPDRLKFAWNNALPHDILICEMSFASDDFNPRRRVFSKTYHYSFFTDRPLPLGQQYGWYFSRPVDLDVLHQALQLFVGTHDFRSFCTGYDMQSTIRTIHSIHLEYDHNLHAHRIVVQGPGFLRYMIRRIVGACLAVASKDQFSCEDISIALAKKDPAQILPNSPAKGLLLYKIVYEDDLLQK
ncbi:tRNA pseudouridine(38-40) synthase TruA [Candidatus Babeliales bacterium]|nr:tRNA pseudouridine(38-40) synthase TruA [Candidatus Babeliales bacterium]MBP9844081.1 tRNA pseudouridine(38-40) synthase TruA [Candidatus Babeliales bacterium]